MDHLRGEGAEAVTGGDAARSRTLTARWDLAQWTFASDAVVIAGT